MRSLTIVNNDPLANDPLLYEFLWSRSMPISRHPLTDWFFYEFVRVLEQKKVRVYKVENLQWLGNRMWGRFHRKRIIYLEASLDKDDLLTTLVHEIAHYFFHKGFDHSGIEKLEKLLSYYLTQPQKDYLLAYIPDKPLKTKSRSLLNLS